MAIEDHTNLTERLLREIQRELADMRDDRTVTIAMLERHDATLGSIAAEKCYAPAFAFIIPVVKPSQTHGEAANVSKFRI